MTCVLVALLLCVYFNQNRLCLLDWQPLDSLFLVGSSWLYIELISKTNYSSICSENQDSRFRKLV